MSGHQLTVGASVGVAHGTPRRDGPRPHARRGHRDVRGEADRQGPGLAVRARHADQGVAPHRLQQELARAVERGEIDVAYQPIIHLESGRTVMLEALARWRRPGQPPVPAEVFIALAEESGAINKIGPEVLRQAATPPRAGGICRARRAGHRGERLGAPDPVRAAGRARRRGAAGQRAAPDAAGAGDHRERGARRLDRVAAEFRQLQAMGVGIAVDDFGAGYSSLGLLMSLDVDTLKIDRSLLDFDTTRRGSLVMAITELGHTLGLKVVAEGVETPSHLHRAREACCDAVQGYHLSRPLEAGAVGHFLTTWAGSRLANPVSRG